MGLDGVVFKSLGFLKDRVSEVILRCILKNIGSYTGFEGWFSRRL